MPRLVPFSYALLLAALALPAAAPAQTTIAPEDDKVACYNGADLLILTDGAEAATIASFGRCLDLFDGNDPEAVAAARRRWAAAKAAGHALTYWQQTDGGGWARKE